MATSSSNTQIKGPSIVICAIVLGRSLAAVVHRCAPRLLDFGTTYYWRVDEVGGAGPYQGDVWSFTTQDPAAAR